MLPPIDDSILQANPKFAALHMHLTENILNPNGSTKLHPAQKDRDAVSSALKASRTRAARSHLLITALRDLDISSSPESSSSKPSQLPPEVIELILLLTSHLTSPTPQTKLLERTTQWQSLQSYLPRIGALVSAHLHSQALALARVHFPTTNASYLHRTIPKLLPSVTTLQDSISEKKAALHKARACLVAKTLALLQAYQCATIRTIQLLETSKHGSLSLERHYQTRITFLAALVQRVSLEAKEKKAKGENMVYSDEVRMALEEYVRHLKDARERLRERRKGAERVLWGYGVGRYEGEGEGERPNKEKVMKEIARVYGELMTEVKEVGRDVERLRRRR